MGRGKILTIIDPKLRDRSILAALEGEGWYVREAGLSDYQTMLPLEGPDCVLLGLRGDMDGGKAILQAVKAIDDNLPVIWVVGGKISVEGAVEAMKAGAFDYFLLPVDAARLRLAVANAIRLAQLAKRVFLLENQVGWRGRFDNIIGHSAKMQEIFQLVHTVAKSNATVLITGESGTGKELVARALHVHSHRARERFIDINCGAIPRELLENELFGHERGAFTGADRRYAGSCERAHKGSLFLDEICEMPPLRERPEDVPLLAKHFLEKSATKAEKLFVDFASEALDLLVAYDWPGNVRELENVVERIVVLHNDTQAKIKHLPPHIQKVARRTDRPRELVLPLVDPQTIVPLDLVEKYAIEAALEKCVGNVGEAAKRLKIGQATLYRKIRQYGLRH
ncbi:MAG: sigma-54-dependent Fis family transcriptional regulator [Deltaproteobacteria bacterium]|nr:sigma-54-dependent Fis family transcriptional regulator [Deltaproteobacteria bacterium]